MRRPALVLVIAVLVMAWAGPLVRLTSAPPLAVAAWRLTIASLILLPIYLTRARRSDGPAQGRPLQALGGLVLAIHFAAWITSLRLTSVAASAVLVSMSPVFAWILSARFLGEKPSRRQALGLLLAIAGAAIIALGDAGTAGRSALLGDALALLGAACGGIYFTIGRTLRARLDLVAYVTPVYGVAALVLLGAAGVRGEAFTPYPASDWLVFAALAAGPMLIGHTGLNYALRHLPAWAVGAAALGEPIGAVLIAWLLPAIAEPPGPAALAGGAVCLAGIALVLSRTDPGRKKRPGKSGPQTAGERGSQA